MLREFCSLWYGEGRPRWLGPIPYDYPAYLNGELPGDYGFDIAGLSKDSLALQKYFKYGLLISIFCPLLSHFCFMNLYFVFC